MKGFLAGVLLFIFISFAQGIYIIEQEADFDSVLANNENVLVLFTKLNSKACPDCSTAKEAFEEFTKEGLPCTSIVVDCFVTKEVCQKYEFNQLPALLLFHGELAIYEYDKPYVYLDAVIAFVNTYIAPKFSVVTSESELETQIKDNKVSIVGFFEQGVEDKRQGSFRRTAAQLFQEYKFIEFVMTKDEIEILENFDATFGTVKILSFLGGEIQSKTFSDPDGLTRKKLISWIEENTPWVVHPLQVSESNTPSLQDKLGHLPILTVFVENQNEEQLASALYHLENAVGLFAQKIIFTYFVCKPEFEGLVKRWGLTNKEYPFMTISSFPKGVYVYQGEEITKESIIQFSNDYLEGKIEISKIKQPIPENDNGLIKTVVHDNYRATLFDPTRDVVVFFYLPEDECAHCPDFYEKYEKIAAKLANVPDLTFAKLDVRANSQIPSVRVSNFPTVHIYKMASKAKEVVYSGRRTEEALEHWIVENLTHSTYSASDLMGFAELI